MGTRSKLGAMTCTLALTLTACSSKGDKVATIKKPPSTTEPSTTTTALEVTTTSVTSTTTPKAAPKPPAGLGPGARGASVMALERRLDELRYDVGKVDGVFDSTTGHAVMAFQKIHGMNRTGRASGDVIARLANPTTPGALVPGGGATRIEVEIKRQVLFLYRGNALHRIVSVSTGSGKRYCVEGQCDTAVTPGGSFRITRRITGWRTSRLGRLWNPLYFNGGIAIHGSPSVPGYPASHGCVRIPMSTAGWLPGVVPNGTPVYVVGGPKAPVPFNEPAPTDLRPDPAPSPREDTTTTAPKPTSTTTSSTTSTTTSTTLYTRPTVPERPSVAG